MQRIAVLPPIGRRLPFRVERAPMAKAMDTAGGPTLRRRLRQMMTESASIEVQPVTLDSWMKAWPSVIFFYGPDEAKSTELRQRVIGELLGFVEHLHAADAGDPAFGSDVLSRFE